jgi:hypothetical protein
MGFSFVFEGLGPDGFAAGCGWLRKKPIKRKPSKSEMG